MPRSTLGTPTALRHSTWLVRSSFQMLKTSKAVECSLKTLIDYHRIVDSVDRSSKQICSIRTHFPWQCCGHISASLKPETSLEIGSQLPSTALHFPANPQAQFIQLCTMLSSSARYTSLFMSPPLLLTMKFFFYRTPHSSGCTTFTSPPFLSDFSVCRGHISSLLVKTIPKLLRFLAHVSVLDSQEIFPTFLSLWSLGVVSGDIEFIMTAGSAP